jgi:tetratricopeptide (TPR) repeat protein
LIQQSLALYQVLDHHQRVAELRAHQAMIAEGQGDYIQAQTAFSESLAVLRSLSDPRSIAWALNCLGQVCQRLGQWEAARTHHEEALAISLELASPTGICWSKQNLGHVARSLGELDAAHDAYKQVQAIELEHGLHAKSGWTLVSLGRVAVLAGDLETANDLLEQASHCFQEAKDQEGIAHATLTRGQARQAQGDWEGARSDYLQVLSLLRDHGDPWSHTLALEAIAELLVAEGRSAAGRAALTRAEQASRIFAAAEALRTRLKMPLAPVEQPVHDRRIAALRATLGEERFAASWAAGAALSFEQATGEVLAT